MRIAMRNASKCFLRYSFKYNDTIHLNSGSIFLLSFIFRKQSMRFIQVNNAMYDIPYDCVTDIICSWNSRKLRTTASHKEPFEVNSFQGRTVKCILVHKILNQFRLLKGKYLLIKMFSSYEHKILRKKNCIKCNCQS